MAANLDPRLRATMPYSATRPKKPSPLRHVISVDDFEAVTMVEQKITRHSARPLPEKPQEEPLSADLEDGEWEDVPEDTRDKTNTMRMEESSRRDMSGRAAERAKIILTLPTWTESQKLGGLGIFVVQQDEKCDEKKKSGTGKGSDEVHEDNATPVKCDSVLGSDATQLVTNLTKRKREDHDVDTESASNHSSRRRTDAGPLPVARSTTLLHLPPISTSATLPATTKMFSSLSFGNGGGFKPGPDPNPQSVPSIHLNAPEAHHANDGVREGHEDQSDSFIHPLPKSAAENAAEYVNTTQQSEAQGPPSNVVPRVWEHMVSYLKHKQRPGSQQGDEDTLSDTSLGPQWENIIAMGDTTPSSFTVRPGERATTRSAESDKELLEAARIVDWQPRIFDAAASRFNTALSKRRGNVPRITGFRQMDSGRYVPSWDDGKERTARGLLEQLGLACGAKGLSPEFEDQA